MAINIAIDGPSGAGKSTLAKLAAEQLGFIYVDTGALYRTVGVNALRKGLDTSSPEQVIPALEGLDITLKYIDGAQHVYLNGEDVSGEIRLPPASMAASNVSAIPEVRAFLFDLQKDIAHENNCVMDGRDIGTAILPEADVKIFLSASPEDRAKRRYDELIERGTPKPYGEVLEEIKLRDHNDSSRSAAPLKAAADAIKLDTTGFELEKSFALIMDVILSKLTKEDDEQ